MKNVFVTGTDTDVGKTVVCAGLCLRFKASYFKPIQCGTVPHTDSEFVARFIPSSRICPSSYVLKAPLSPNQAALREGVCIQKKNISLPLVSGSLVIEGAGGSFVPLNQKGETVADLIQWLKVPALVVARSTLGTLNHTFLTLSFLRSKKIKVLGLVLLGPSRPENKKDIEKWGRIPVLLELPFIKKLSQKALLSHFKSLPSFFN